MADPCWSHLRVRPSAAAPCCTSLPGARSPVSQIPPALSASWAFLVRYFLYEIFVSPLLNLCLSHGSSLQVPLLLNISLHLPLSTQRPLTLAQYSVLRHGMKLGVESKLRNYKGTEQGQTASS